MQRKYTTSINFNLYLLLFSLLFVGEFAHAQEGSGDVSKVIYLTANTGFKDGQASEDVFQAIVKASQDDENATLLLMGNITPNGGFPEKDKEKQRDDVKQYLQNNLLDPLKEFNGSLILNPGSNEWNKEGHENIDDLESFLQDNGKETEFWPSDGCASKNESLSDDVELVMVDSQWFFEDWDNHPYINNKCDLKTREEFFLEFKDDIKDAQGKTVIVAVHHPIMSNTARNFFEKMGGFSQDSYYNSVMNGYMGRLETIASQFEDVIFVSGNDRNMQFLEDDGIPQIISGTATADIEKVHTRKDSEFGSTENGYAKLTVFKNGSSVVDFFSVNGAETESLFSKEIKRQRAKPGDFKYQTKSDFGKTYEASVYKPKKNKSGLYNWFWGKHYREVYEREVEVPVLFIDTLSGNPVAISEGGGHQSRSLRILDDNENEFTLREIKKSAVRFIQSVIKDHYVEDYMRNTVAESIIQDFYTTAHPYAPFAVNNMLEAVDIYHANPTLYYLPKQKNLNIYNEDYGDKLYMIEEHVGDENKDFETFGKADDILSSADMLLEIRESKDIKIDEPTYIRARLFDMLIGDWDRHSDQWRWAEFEQENGAKLYKAIPRDRDQAFPKYDGAAIELLKLASVEFRAMQSYAPEMRNVKWFNKAGYPLDKAFINQADWSDWQAQAVRLQEELTDEKIDESFATLPEDTQDKSIETIKKTMKIRRDNLINIAKDYYTYFKKFETVIGTENDDSFLMTRKPDGMTNVQISDENGVVFFDNDYTKDETKEIWIYGLDGDDQFKIEGDGNKYIKLKVLGGEENDIYDFENTRNAKLYDYKSKDNTIVNKNANKWLVDSYDINTYDPNKRKYSKNILLPAIAFDPDAGFQIGVSDTYTRYGLADNPFSSEQTFSAKYFSATSGFSASYSGEFAHAFKNWNFGLDALFTSPNYAINFFGFGNETNYDEDDVSLDFNRVGLAQWNVSPSLIWRNQTGYSFRVKGILENLEVDYEANEATGQFFNPENDVFDSQLYAGGEVSFQYNNKTNLIAFVRRGMEFSIVAGYKSNIDDHENKFGYVEPTVSFVYPLHESGLAVLATKINGKVLFNDDYEFYHGATVGGNTSLRGFRNERFNGKQAFYQSTDLRVGVAQFRTNFIPIRLGLTAGFDYGRVWQGNDNSKQWHNSYGGSVFVNGFKAFTGNLGFYQSDEGNRVIFTLGFKF